MRELLRELDDRLREFYVVDSWGELEEAIEVLRLRRQVRIVLEAGYFDATGTAVDMRQLPLVL
jgi:hypothetical protein